MRLEPTYAADPARSFESFGEFYKNSAYAEFEQRHHAGGSFGQSMVQITQDPIDLIDSAVADVVFVHTIYKDVGPIFVDTGHAKIEYQCGPSTLSAQPAGLEAHFAISVPHDLTILALPEERVIELLDRHGVEPNAHLHLADCFRSTEPHLDRLFSGLFKTMRPDRSAANSLLCDGLTLQLMADFCDAKALSPLVVDVAKDPRIARAIEYIETHIGDTLSITELAVIARLSDGHFSRCFRATIGEPVWTYVQRRRCERAKELLLYHRDPLAEIAFRCGFANQAHMTTSLKARYGVTPGAIRREVML